MVTLTPIVAAGVLEAGPMLVHLFHDSTDDATSAADAGAVREALGQSGASILPEEVGEAARAANIPGLTMRELEVLRLVSQGWGTPRIADELGISYHTVRNHIRHCRRKLSAAHQTGRGAHRHTARHFARRIIPSQDLRQAWRFSSSGHSGTWIRSLLLLGRTG